MATSLILWLVLIVVRSITSGRIGYAVDGIILLLGGIHYFNGSRGITIHLIWPPLPLDLVVALLVFFASICATTMAPGDYLRRIGMSLAAQPATRHARVAWMALSTAGYEELVWRVVCQSALCLSLPSWFAVLLVALVFTFWHRNRTQGNLRLIGELFVFSVILGFLYLITADLLLIGVIHATRNYLIGIGGYKIEKI